MKFPAPIVIVGPGRAGLGLARALRRSGARDVSGVARSAAAARRAARLTPGVKWTAWPEARLCEAAVVLICVPDDGAREVARAVLSAVSSRAVVLHTSGSLPAQLLRARRGAAAIGSMHPLYSFPPPGTPADLSRIWWGVGGPPRARAMARRLARGLGGRTIIVPESRRGAWHLVAALTANHLAALLATASGMASRRLGVSRARAESMLLPLAGSVLASARRSGLRRALTGPIARGDVETVRRHLAQLAHEPRALRALYRILGLEQARLAGSSRALQRLLASDRPRR